MLISLGVLGIAAVVQTLIFAASGSVALLADLIHNFGDALTAVPLGIAFLLRSERAERAPGCSSSPPSSSARASRRRSRPPAHRPDPARPPVGARGRRGHRVRRQLHRGRGPPARRRAARQPGAVADGHHARADAYVSLAVIASAAVVAIGAPIADPLIGLAITLVILRITWQSWATVRGRYHHAH